MRRVSSPSYSRRSPWARPAAGARAGPAGLPQDPRTAPPDTRRRCNARGAGSLWPTARAASRAARSPDITSCTLGEASPPNQASGRGCQAAATTRRPRCRVPCCRAWIRRGIGNASASAQSQARGPCRARLSKRSNLCFRPVSSAGFEPAFTAPERVAVHAPDLRGTCSPMSCPGAYRAQRAPVGRGCPLSSVGCGAAGPPGRALKIIRSKTPAAPTGYGSAALGDAASRSGGGAAGTLDWCAGAVGP